MNEKYKSRLRALYEDEIKPALKNELNVGIMAVPKIEKIVVNMGLGEAISNKKILEDAIKNAESKKKEALIEAREDILKSKNEFDQEIKERRNELTRQERRVTSKEEALDKKAETLEKKDETLNRKIKENEERAAEIDRLKTEELVTLQRISGMSKEQARDKLIEEMVEEVKHEQAMRMQVLEEQFKDEADTKAKNIIALAIQRCAADHVAEVTVSVVALPSEEMKGRIIGREGRNIRTIETLTGVDLIVDDTPETITVSSFDPIKREIARIALEKLIADGRIHPTRIEEMVDKATKEVEHAVKRAGEQATFEVGIHGFNPEIIKLLGRLKYRTSYGQNVLNHSLEVSYLCGLMATELGIDPRLAKRAGLLHDIGKALDHEMEGTHIQLGAEFAKRYKENDTIVNAIEAHHGTVEPKSTVAVLVQAADAISAARPGARREDLQNYIKRLEALENIATGFNGVERSFAIQAGREVRIIVKPEVITDDKMVTLAREIAEKIETTMEYPGEIKVNLIRETRAFGVAK